MSDIKICVVEDNEEIVRKYEEYLDEYDIDTFTSGREAAEQAASAYDILFLDFHLPDKSGKEVLESFFESGFDGMTCLVTVANPGALLLSMPIDDFLQKPVTATDLEEKIKVMREREEFSNGVQSYVAVSRKLELLEKAHDSPRNYDQYGELQSTARELYFEHQDEIQQLDSDCHPAYHKR